jgi:hypothetical protein
MRQLAEAGRLAVDVDVAGNPCMCMGMGPSARRAEVKAVEGRKGQEERQEGQEEGHGSNGGGGGGGGASSEQGGSDGSGEFHDAQLTALALAGFCRPIDAVACKLW